MRGPWYSHVTNRWRKWCHIGASSRGWFHSFPDVDRASANHQKSTRAGQCTTDFIMLSQFSTVHSNITGHPEFPSCYSDLATVLHRSTELQFQSSVFKNFIPGIVGCLSKITKCSITVGSSSVALSHYKVNSPKSHQVNHYIPLYYYTVSK